MRVMLPDRPSVTSEYELEQLDGVLKQQNQEDKLLRSILDDDKQAVEDGKLLNEAISSATDCLIPDTIYEKLVKDYRVAEKTYGKTFLQYISGYDPEFLKKNSKIPEFQNELKKKIKKKVLEMKERKLIDQDGRLLEEAYVLASLVLYVEELDHMVAEGFLGERFHEKASVYGQKSDARNYRKGDRYKDFALKKTLKTSLRRGHSDISKNDIKIFEHESKGSIEIVYAIDSSASMKGDKTKMAKKAGIALAYKAIEDKDRVGLLVFDDEVNVSLSPTLDFMAVVKEIAKIKPRKQTNFASLFEQSIKLFSTGKGTKHLILLTDALPTSGEKPKEETLKACSAARSSGITVSIIGISLDGEGERLAKDLVGIGEGRLYSCHDLEKIDSIILEEYGMLSS